MNFELIKHQIEYLIYFLVYEKNGSLYKHPFTRIDTLRPQCFRKSTDSDLYAYNLVTDQYELIPWKSIKSNMVMLFSTDIIRKGMAGILEQSEIDTYIKENLDFIKSEKELASTAMQIERQYIESLDYTSLKEHNNVFYKIVDFENRDDLFKKILDRAFSDYFIHAGLLSKQEILLQRIFTDIDVTNLPALKTKWYELIQIYKKKAIRQLQAELEEAEKEKNNEDVEEINIILNIVNDTDQSILTDLESIDSYKSLVQYWPPILLPAPRFVE